MKSNLIYQFAKAKIGSNYKARVQKAIGLRDRQSYTLLRDPAQSITLGQITSLSKLLKVPIDDIIYLCRQQSNYFKNQQLKKHEDDDNA